jgi:HK97 family phage major capsid protein
MNELKAVSKTDDELRVANHIVLFGGKDLQDEFFTPDTKLESPYTKNSGVLVDWEHGQDEPDGDEILGRVDWSTMKRTDDGVWVERVLDRHNAYMKLIEPLIDEGIVGTSTEAVGKGIKRTKKGEIQIWPIKRDSLTVQPAEPRMLSTNAISALKSLAEHSPDIKAMLSRGDEEIADTGADDTGADATVRVEVVTMSEPTEEVATDVVSKEDFDALVAVVKAQAESTENLVKTLADKPAESKAGTITEVKDEADRELEGNPFATFGEFLKGVVDADSSGGAFDKRLHPLKSSDAGDEYGYSVAGAMGAEFVGSVSNAKAFKAAPTGLGESSGPLGGYLVDSDRAPGILSRVYEVGALLQRVSMDTVSANANGMTYYAEDETSRADGSRRGGIRFYWVAENSAITSSAPTFRVMELKLRKAAGLVYATDEQLADTSALESYIFRILPEELRFGVEDSIINGLGTGQPEGILNSNATVSIAKETGQAATTIVAENISKMWARLYSPSKRSAVWLVNADVAPQLHQLNFAVGTGGALVYMPPGGLSGAPYGTLLGRPVIEHESCATLGTVGDILLVDPTEYQMIEKGGIESASSIHVRFTQGEQVFRFIWRVDGQSSWSAALTPLNGTNTVSPFISLATRA